MDVIGTKLCAKVARWVRAIRNTYVIEKIMYKIKPFKSTIIHYLTSFMHIDIELEYKYNIKKGVVKS